MGERSAVWYRRTRLWLGLAGLLVVWITAAPLLADCLIADRSIEQADAIVVLSGAADHAQRALGGATAFKNGVANRVILTNDDQRGGWDDKEKGNPYFIDRSEQELLGHGVPLEAIEKLPNIVRGTDEEAELLVRLAVERGYRGLVIVTSDYHSRRALWTFDRAVSRSDSHLSIGLIRSPSGARYPDRYTWWMSLRGWRSVGAEYLKIGYYWVFY